MKSSKIHIISSGTGVGKTLITSMLCKILNQQNKNYIAVKPVISGFEFSNKNNDLLKIINAQNKKYTKLELKNYSAFIYKKPLSPDQAALTPQQIKKTTDALSPRLYDGVYCKAQATVKEVNNFVNHTAKTYNRILIEGVGGICVPLNKSEVYLDFLKQSFNKKSDKIILVLGSYLGSLSHSITTLKTLELYNLKPDIIIITQNLKPKDELYIDIKSTEKSLSNFTDTEILQVKHLKNQNDKRKALSDILTKLNLHKIL